MRTEPPHSGNSVQARERHCSVELDWAPQRHQGGFVVASGLVCKIHMVLDQACSVLRIDWWGFCILNESFCCEWLIDGRTKCLM